MKISKKIKFRNLEITPIKNQLKEDFKFAVFMVLMFVGIVFIFGGTLQIMKLLGWLT
jgi:hypothetical protein